MKNSIVLLGLLCQSTLMMAQLKNEKLPTYKVWVYTTENIRFKGILHEAKDEGIVVDQDLHPEDLDLYLVEYGRISYLKMRRKGQVGKSAGIGCLAGAVVGGAIGYGTAPEEPSWFTPAKDDAAVIGAVGMGISGAVLGAIVGSGKIRVNIQADSTLYRTQLNSLVNYDQVPNN